MSAIAALLAQLARSTLGEGAQLGGGGLELLVRTLGDRRDQPDVKLFASFCRLFLRAYENYDYDIGRNGEAWLMGRLQSLSPKVVFDVGANVGDWSVHAALTFPQATIHAFEPVPDTHRALARSATMFGGRIKANAFGLADRSVAMPLTVMADDSTLSSIVTLHEGEGRQVECAMCAGDAYLEEQGIERIDFLKIDVEGAEHLVLQGLARALAQGRIGVIQFEYGQANIVTRFLLRDFHLLLEGHGYLVGKLFPNRVDFRPYRFEHEDFIGPNFVAVPAAREDVKKLLTEN